METDHPSVAVESRDGLTCHVLREPSTGSEAWILPDIGANCVRFSTTIGGEQLDVIRQPPTWDAYRERPTYHGAAILFPFPGRIRGGRFTFGGVTYQLPLNEPDPGNAIHGCVSGNPWTTVALTADPSGDARGIYQIGSDSNRTLLESFPFRFRLSVEIRLKNGALGYAFVAENIGDQPMPIGLGIHPYFPLPLGSVGSLDDCEISIDAPYYWAQEGYMPVGNAIPAEQSVDLRVPRSLRALASVGVGGVNRMVNLVHTQFSDTAAPLPADGGIRWKLTNPRSRRSVVVEADAAFSASVTYVPVTREKVSFEPHTCVPNAFNLSSEGKVAGTITLRPREFWRGSVSIRAEGITK
jgi:aldose 1-epimerase